MSLTNNFPNIRPTLLLDFARAKQLDPRITFTRASTGVFYDGDTDAKAEENLFPSSQEFNNSAFWNNTNSTETANTTTAPDGTTTADTLTASAGAGIHDIFPLNQVSVSSALYATSIFVKKNTHDFIQICLANQATEFANFNVSTGVVGTTGGTVTAAITDVGNGWYRCSMIYTSSGTNRFPIFALVSSASAARRESWTAAGTESVFLWGAQLEQRSAVTAYTATTTQAITNYIPVLLTAPNNTPRFDHSPTTDASLGLLIEEQRTNLLTYSSQFDDAAWTKVNSSITVNSNVAPDGTLTADTLVENTATADHAFRGDATITAGATITFTIYAKAAGRTNIRLQFADTATTNQTLAFYNLSTGTTSDLSQTGSATLGAASITAVGNGWYRCVLTGRIDGVSTTARCRVSLSNTSLVISYAGDGFSGAFIWGAQLEAGAFPTSYIATVASQVTRSADDASMTGTNFSSWFNNAEGTLYVEAATNATDSLQRRAVSVNDATTSNFIDVSRIGNTAQSRAVVTTNGTSVFNSLNSAWDVNTFAKVVNAYKVNDFAAILNNNAIRTDNDGVLPVVSRLVIGNITVNNPWNGTISKIAYYPIRLPNNQLIALTGS